VLTENHKTLLIKNLAFLNLGKGNEPTHCVSFVRFGGSVNPFDGSPAKPITLIELNLFRLCHMLQESMNSIGLKFFAEPNYK